MLIYKTGIAIIIEKLKFANMQSEAEIYNT